MRHLPNNVLMIRVIVINPLNYAGLETQFDEIAQPQGCHKLNALVLTDIDTTSVVTSVHAQLLTKGIVNSFKQNNKNNIIGT